MIISQCVTYHFIISWPPVFLIEKEYGAHQQHVIDLWQSSDQNLGWLQVRHFLGSAPTSPLVIWKFGRGLSTYTNLLWQLSVAFMFSVFMLSFFLIQFIPILFVAVFVLLNSTQCKKKTPTWWPFLNTCLVVSLSPLKGLILLPFSNHLLKFRKDPWNSQPSQLM